MCRPPHDASKVFLLSHFHSDHYTGITSAWNTGTIYCSQVRCTCVVAGVVAQCSEAFEQLLSLLSGRGTTRNGTGTGDGVLARTRPASGQNVASPSDL